MRSISLGIDHFDSVFDVVQRIAGQGQTDQIDDQRYRKAQPVGQQVQADIGADGILLNDAAMGK